MVTGPIDTSIKRSLKYLLAVGMIGYGLIYPLALKSRISAISVLNRWIPSPPLFLWPFFVTSGILELGLFHFNEAEVAELLIGLALALMTLYQKNQFALNNPTRSTGITDNHLAKKYIILATTICFLASATTFGLYSMPRLQAKMDKRIAKGVKKFASRYKRHDRCDIALDLYKTLLVTGPNRPSLLRNIAECYKKTGWLTDAKQALRRALKIDLREGKRIPNRVPVALSLARTYDKFGDKEKRNQSLRKALSNALAKVKRDPDNPNHAYWLGYVYSEMGNRIKAVESFARAHRLKPTSKKYRKAYLKALNRM